MTDQLRLDLELITETMSRTVRVRSINGQPVADWPHGPTFMDYLRHLVREGWTLSRVVDSKTLIYQHPEPGPEAERTCDFAAQNFKFAVS